MRHFTNKEGSSVIRARKRRKETSLRWLLPACGLLATALPLVAGRSAAAQETVVIPEEPSPPCVIDLTPVGPPLRWQGLDDENWVAGATDMDMLPDGRLVMAEQFSDDFFVMSPDGSAGRRVGRGGEGPGEYAFVRWVRVHGDRVHVFDPLLMRRTVLDAVDFGVL